MRAVCVVAVSIAVVGSVLIAQTTSPSAPPSPATIGFMHAIHATNNVETTAAFYKEVFGLSSPVRPFPSAAVAVLNNAPGVTLRVSMLNLAPAAKGGFNFELTEFGNVERHAGRPKISDPGAPHMKFLVRNLDTVVANVKRVGGTILTKSGAPIDASTAVGKAKAVFFTDPDGYIVEAIQVPSPPADAPEGNVIGSIMGVTVADMDQSMKFWHGLLGFDVKGDTKFASDQAMLDLMGLEKGSSYRSVFGMVPGSAARIEFTEFKGMPRTKFDLHTVDPGACGMAIRVAHIADLLKRMKAEGTRVSSRNGDLVEWNETTRNAFIKDPDGLNIEIVGSADPSQ